MDLFEFPQILLEAIKPFIDNISITSVFQEPFLDIDNCLNHIFYDEPVSTEEDCRMHVKEIIDSIFIQKSIFCCDITDDAEMTFDGTIIVNLRKVNEILRPLQNIKILKE